MKQDNNEELFPVVDEQGNILGSATRGECHNGSKLLHPVVHLHVFNSQGQLYLQKRPVWKDIQPGKWDTAVGGHVDLGESVEQALRREVREELGITDFTPQAVTHYVFESTRERELVFVYRTTYDGTVTASGVLKRSGKISGKGSSHPTLREKSARSSPTCRNLLHACAKKKGAPQTDAPFLKFSQTARMPRESYLRAPSLSSM